LIKEILKSADFQKKLLWFNGLLPLSLLIFDWNQNNLGANPPEALIRTTGVIAIIFLLLSLAVTPMAKELKWSWTIKHRRWLGLWSFYYALLHLFGYILFDKDMNFFSIILDIKKRPFILLGFLAFIIMIPLAVTSSNSMIRKLGAKKWQKLHKLTYLIAIFVAIHYWLIVKSDIFYPGLAGLFLFIFIFYRFYNFRQKHNTSKT
jgi:sulfoxide reductase heme-binding subunit YedZ